MCTSIVGDTNPQLTKYVDVAAQGCARFAEILLARTHHHFFNERCSFTLHRLFIVESCNSCHVDEQCVHVLAENVNISAKRAHPSALSHSATPTGLKITFLQPAGISENAGCCLK